MKQMIITKLRRAIMSKNGRPKVTRKQIQGLIDGFEKQLPDLEAELEAANKALSDAKRQEIGRQKAEAPAGQGVLPRATMFFIEDFPEREHLEYTKKRAVGKVGDVQRRIRLLKRALSMTPE
jgi:hypothetical protein